MKYFSLRMKLDDVVKDKDFEQQVLENLRYARKITGKQFRVIFWNENLTENDCKEFIKRNTHLLFQINTKITKQFRYSWFLIQSEGDKSTWRYKSDAGILKGIVSYIKLTKHINQQIEED